MVDPRNYGTESGGISRLLGDLTNYQATGVKRLYAEMANAQKVNADADLRRALAIVGSGGNSLFRDQIAAEEKRLKGLEAQLARRPGAGSQKAVADSRQKLSDLRGLTFESAWRAGTPGIYDRYDRLQGSLDQALQQQRDSGLMERQREIALGWANRDGSLSEQDGRAVDQDTRRAFAARGMALSPQAAVAEVMNRDGARRQRLGQQFGLLGSVDALEDQRRTRMLGLEAQALQTAQDFDPTLRMFNWTPPSQGLAGIVGNMVSAPIGPALGYMSDMYNTNLNMAASYDINRQNREFALKYGQMMMPQGGGMGGALTGALGGAASGAAMGSALGPYGMAAGAVIGGVAGGLGGM